MKKKDELLDGIISLITELSKSPITIKISEHNNVKLHFAFSPVRIFQQTVLYLLI
jgi:hypothetical protein